MSFTYQSSQDTAINLIKVIKPKPDGAIVSERASTSQSYAVLTRSISDQLSSLRSDLPGVMKGFGDLAKASVASGALSEKTKELIALALGGCRSLRRLHRLP
jgi:alkylhydroperoxidase/carboxymuconolactone decarboxylase family protein YurZ